MKPLGDCRLYTFIDSAYLEGRLPVEIARALVDGGSDLVQLRAKDWSPDRILKVAEAIQPILHAGSVGLVINDHPEIARACGADFCHLGQEDFFEAGHRSADDARGSGAVWRLGLSSHAPEQALRAVQARADYVAIGPVYATGTKPGALPVTLEYVRWAAANLTIPWFAIGGIDGERLAAVLEAGARRICVVSAILKAPDVAQACRAFRKRLESKAT
ncbi:MAG: thiamine phosphate synthase [Verrucomicrobia bacterium]|nr:thiamine phosphate synthase [Verrucomicrobiota bacterium]